MREPRVGPKCRARERHTLDLDQTSAGSWADARIPSVLRCRLAAVAARPVLATCLCGRKQDDGFVGVVLEQPLHALQH